MMGSKNLTKKIPVDWVEDEWDLSLGVVDKCLDDLDRNIKEAAKAHNLYIRNWCETVKALLYDLNGDLEMIMLSGNGDHRMEKLRTRISQLYYKCKLLTEFYKLPA